MSSLAGEEARFGTVGVEAEDRPLTDQERALLIRLLSDPFSYPIIFKTWLVSFLESSDILLPRSSIQGLTTLLSTTAWRKAELRAGHYEGTTEANGYMDIPIGAGLTSVESFMVMYASPTPTQGTIVEGFWPPHPSAISVRVLRHDGTVVANTGVAVNWIVFGTT